MFEALKPSPRVIFLDLYDPSFPFEYSGFTQDQFAAEVASRFAAPLTTTFVWFASPIDALVEDLLIPIYEDPNSPLQPDDLVRAGWNSPKTIGRSTLIPKLLAESFAALTPRVVLTSHLNAALCNLLVGGDPNLVVIVPDATGGRIRETLEIGDIPTEICIALHIRATSLYSSSLYRTPCASYGIEIGRKSCSASEALDRLLATAINPPSV